MNCELMKLAIFLIIPILTFALFPGAPAANFVGAGVGFFVQPQEFFR